MTGTAERKLGKNILLGAAGCILGLGQGEKALPISCLFCAPTAGISRQSKATPSSSQGSVRKEVRLKSASNSKSEQIEVKRMRFGC